MSDPRNSRRTLRLLGGGVAALVVAAGAVVACNACKTLPSGASGNDADAAAHKIEAWVNKDAWDSRTDGVQFRFRDMHELQWDKKRGFLHYKKVGGDVDVWLDLWDRGGFADKAGVALEGEEKQKALDEAWKFYCNDTFWLNPLVKLFDPGTTRELVDMDGKRGLKVTYASGGVTPGDSYVWFFGDDGEPKSVRMWVSVLPVKGLAFDWAGWITLPSGAKVATQHKAAGMDHAVDLGDIAPLDGADALFAKLAARRSSGGGAARAGAQ